FGFIAIFHFLFYKNANKIFLTKFFFMTLFFYILDNLWWLSQFFSFIYQGNYKQNVSSFFSNEGNFATLNILSSRLGNLSDVVRLVHHNFFYDEQTIFWAKIFS